MSQRNAMDPIGLSRRYDAVIDTRPAEAYAIDHAPDAISLPVMSAADLKDVERAADESVMESQRLWESRAMANIHKLLPRAVDSLGLASEVVVYGDGAGDEAQLLAERLQHRGMVCAVLSGGYARYRAAVVAALRTAGQNLSCNLVVAKDESGARLVAELAKAGAQTLQLTRMLDAWGGHAGIGSRARFESELVDQLQRMTRSARVWIDYASTVEAQEWLPEGLKRAIRQDSTLFMLATAAGASEKAQENADRDPGREKRYRELLASLEPLMGSVSRLTVKSSDTTTMRELASDLLSAEPPATVATVP